MTWQYDQATGNLSRDGAVVATATWDRVQAIIQKNMSEIPDRNQPRTGK